MRLPLMMAALVAVAGLSACSDSPELTKRQTTTTTTTTYSQPAAPPRTVVEQNTSTQLIPSH